MCAIVVPVNANPRLYRIAKDDLWTVLANVRDFYEDEHPLAEALLALGEMRDASEHERRRAHRDLLARIERGPEPGMPWPPQVRLFDEARAWVLHPVEADDLFERGRIERAWHVDPARPDEPAPAPAARRAGLTLGRWVEQQTREGRYLVYPLVDTGRLAAEAEQMLALAGGYLEDRAA